MTVQRQLRARSGRQAAAHRSTGPLGQSAEWPPSGARRGRKASIRRSAGAWGAVLLVVCGVAMACTPAASASGLPRVPACFYQAGYCEGIYINPAVAPAMETNDKHGIFDLHASPLQFTEPVLCGEFCIYNHLNWVVGAPILSGCQTNSSDCKVRVKGGWLPVLVDQNDTSIALYLLYSPPKGDVVLSGRVVERECVPHHEPCKLDVVPVKRQAIAAVGKRGTFETETEADGTYAMPVPKGSYKVRAVGSKFVQPAARSVDARGDVSRLDFDLCKQPRGYRGPHLSCRLVEIDGQALDVAGKPYEHANVSTTDDSAQADASGRFVLFTEPGAVAVEAESRTLGFHRASGSSTVHATGDFATVRVTLAPKISISQASGTEVVVHIDGIPLTTGTLTFAIGHDPAIENPSCISQQSEQVAITIKFRTAAAVFDVPSTLLSQNYCSGNYIATVTSGTTTLATEPFAIH
jgi:hypothetical protein